MRTWHQIFTELDIEAEQVATKSYSVATPAETKLVADETAVLADAQARTRGASNDDERRIAAAFWAQFHIYRRKPK